MTSLNQAAFVKERCAKDELYFSVYDLYRPDYKKHMITFKFYSKYEVVDFDDVDGDIIDKIKRVTTDVPNVKYEWPATENQRYGWFTEPLVDIDRKDQRYYHPKLATDFIKHQLQLQMEEQGFPKTKFTGVPFKVQ